MAPPLSALYTLSFLLALLTTLLVASSLRLLAILPRAQSPKHSSAPHQHAHPTLHARPTRARILVVLGSGGHTHEMLALLRDLDTRKYVHRTYVVSSGDSFSAQRAVAFEAGLEEAAIKCETTTTTTTTTKESSKAGVDGALRGADAHCVGPQHYTICTIPRARRIHQPLYTTPFTALRTLLAAFPPLLSLPTTTTDTQETPLPHLILTNGPATAVILVLAALLLRFFNIRGAHSRRLCRTIYVESFARVTTLSLSGKLLVRVVDRFLVQWEALDGYAGRAEYGGILV